jgi:D-glycero-D-manno-heptose 1,7-bisphosphate phosphatase
LSEIIDAMIAKRAGNFENIDYVFLDRDGVLNRNLPGSGHVTSWEQLELFPGVEEAVGRLNRSGRKVIVVTNQRGIALGLHSEDDLHALHVRLCEHLAACGAHLDAIYYCPHDDGQCNCRKPETGMFRQAFRDFPGATADNSIMVGDSLSDMEAASHLGMRGVFLADPAKPPNPDADRAATSATACAVSLLDCVERFLTGSGQ